MTKRRKFAYHLPLIPSLGNKYGVSLFWSMTNQAMKPANKSNSLDIGHSTSNSQELARIFFTRDLSWIIGCSPLWMLTHMTAWRSGFIAWLVKPQTHILPRKILMVSTKTRRMVNFKESVGTKRNQLDYPEILLANVRSRAVGPNYRPTVQVN